MELMDAAERILRLLDTAHPIAWVGAGISAGAGFIAWPALTEELCRLCGVDHTGRYDFDDLVTLAEQCREANREAYERTLIAEFGPRANIEGSRPLVHFLRWLPFDAILTTNFDHLLLRDNDMPGQQRLRYHAWPDLDDADLYGDPTTIYHLHGLANDVDGFGPLVLARSDFDEAYENPGLLRTFLTNILLRRPILFLGVGRGLQQDYYLESLLRDVQIKQDALRQSVSRPAAARLALLPKVVGMQDGVEQAREDDALCRTQSYLADLGVDVATYEVRYDERAGRHSHEGLHYVMKEVWQAVSRAEPSVAETGADSHGLSMQGRLIR